MPDYAAALLTDARGRIRDTKKLANNTYARRDGDAVAVRLHATDVVTLHDDGRVVLDSGGWRTVITRDRMNRYAPGARVYQKRGVMRVRVGGGDFHYVDGFTYDAATGEVLTDAAILDAEDHAVRVQEAARRAVRRWLRSMTPEEARTLGDKLAASDFLGDCLYCQGTTDGRTLGDATGSAHLTLHLAERYYVPSMFVRAFTPYSRAWMAARWWIVDLQSGVVDLQSGDVDHPRPIVTAVADYMAPRIIAEGWPDVDADAYLGAGAELAVRDALKAAVGTNGGRTALVMPMRVNR
jgi:hypothetical protein